MNSTLSYGKFLPLISTKYLKEEFGIAEQYIPELQSTLFRSYSYGKIKTKDDLALQVMLWIKGMEDIGVKV